MFKLLTGLVVAVTIQAQPAYQRGDLVKVQDVEKPVTFKVVGIPNDRIRADDTGVYVNDAAVTGFTREFLTRFKRDPGVVPEGHYFLMGEQRVNNDITEVEGIFPVAALQKVQK